MKIRYLHVIALVEAEGIAVLDKEKSGLTKVRLREAMTRDFPRARAGHDRALLA